MRYLLTNPEQAQAMGRQGREHVRTNFLIPELVRRYLVLMRYYGGISPEEPPFRLNDLSYSEVLNIMRPVPSYLKG
jgi:trehalose synthase